MSKLKIGGQAVLEGVVIQSPRWRALAVRSQSGQIIREVVPIRPLSQHWPVLGLPLIRGSVAIYEALAGAIACLGRSVCLGEEGEEISHSQMALLTVLALALAIGLFFLLPAIVVAPLAVGLSFGGTGLALLEGLVRLAILLAYLMVVGQVADIKRTFQYHGAEHKAINCWEQGGVLAPALAATASRLHPRCGTSFLLLVVAVSIVVFSLFSCQFAEQIAVAYCLVACGGWDSI